MTHNQKNKITNQNLKTIIEGMSNFKEAVEMIKGLSERMGSIAMNASIEAARSASHSETFTNVADQLHHQVKSLNNLQVEFHIHYECAMKQAINLKGGMLAETSLHIQKNLYWQLIQIANNCQKSISKTIEMDIIETHIENKNIHKLRDFLLQTNNSYQENGKITNPKTNLSGIQLFDKRGDLITENIIEKNNMNENIQFHFPIDNRVKEGFVSLSEFKSEIYKLGYLFPYINVKNKAICYFLFIIDPKHILQEIISDSKDIDGSALVLANGTGMIALNQKTYLDNFSWMGAYNEMTDDKIGFSLETARNGWNALWGFAPVFIPNSFPEKMSLSILIWKYLHDPLDTGISQSYLLNALKNESLFKKCFENFYASLKAFSDVAKEFILASEQINMLAVNASIQASMAGKEGRAFGVIADQIGRMTQLSDKFKIFLIESYAYIDQAVRRVCNRYLSYCAKNIIAELQGQFSQFQYILDQFIWNCTLLQNTQLDDTKKILVNIIEKTVHSYPQIIHCILFSGNKLCCGDLTSEQKDAISAFEEQIKKSHTDGSAVYLTQKSNQVLYLDIFKSMNIKFQSKPLVLFMRFDLKELSSHIRQQALREKILIHLKNQKNEIVTQFNSVENEQLSNKQKAEPIEVFSSDVSFTGLFSSLALTIELIMPIKKFTQGTTMEQKIHIENEPIQNENQIKEPQHG